MAIVDITHSHLGDSGGRRHSAAVSDGTSGSSDPLDFAAVGSSSYDQHRASSLSGTEIVGVSDKKRESSGAEFSTEVDLESGLQLSKVVESERDCRICHLSFDATNQESGIPIELGCSCKDDLATAHKHCAEAWFRIKGNKTCEICGSTAHNVVGANEIELTEQWSEVNDYATVAAPVAPIEARNFWHGHRFLNFLLACMVFAFVISWLFHFNVHS